MLADRLLAWQAGVEAKRHHAAWQTLFQDAEAAQAFVKAMTKALVERYGLEKAPESAAGSVTFAAQDRFVMLKLNRGGQGALLLDTASEVARTELAALLEGGAK